jgi:hypothetical protein
LFKINFNIILPLTPRSSKWSLLHLLRLKFSISHLSNASFVYCLSYLSWLDHPNNIRWGVQITKLFFNLFQLGIPVVSAWAQISPSALCCHTPSICAILLMWETKFHAYAGQQTQLSMCTVLISKRSESRRQEVNVNINMVNFSGSLGKKKQELHSEFWWVTLF